MTTPSVSQLRRLFTVQNGGTPKTSVPEYWGGDVPWVTPEDLGRNDGSCIAFSRRTLTPQGVEACNVEVVPPGSIVLSTRAPIGYSAIAGFPLTTNQGCKSLVPLQDLDSRFFEYQLSTRTPDLQILGTGATFMELSTDALASFELHVPPLPTQRKIADFLDRETERIDALIDKKRRLIDLLEEKRTATRDTLIGGVDFPSAPLGRFITSLSQGRSTQAGARPRDDGEWGILKLSAIRRGEYRPRENKALAMGTEVDSTLVPQTDDLLVTRANTPQLVGDVCAVTSGYPRVLLPDLIYRIRLDSRVLPQFASVVMLGSKVRFHLASTARGSSGSMVKLRGEDLRTVRIPIPPLDQQRDLVREVEQRLGRLRDVADRLNTQLALLAEYREALITAAVTGQIDVDAFDTDHSMKEATA